MKGMRTEEILLDDGYRSIYFYDDAGVHRRTTDYDSSGNVTFDIHYEIDELKRVIGWRVFDSSGNRLKIFEVDYGSHGLETERREYGASGELDSVHRLIYNKNDLLIEEQTLDSNRQIRTRTRFSPNGGMLSVEHYDAQGRPV